MEGISPNHPLKSEIYNEIKGNNPSMPVGQKLDPIDVTFIKIWIKMGAKNCSNYSNCDTTNYNYSGRVNPLMTQWCFGWLNSSNADGGFNLSSYSSVSASIAGNKLIESFKVSILIKLVNLQLSNFFQFNNINENLTKWNLLPNK